jgi:BlaI family transcriptional regulator, penicillinase repressor
VRQTLFEIRLARKHTDVVGIMTNIGGRALAETKLSKLEFQIMEFLWAGGDLSIREIQERFPGKRVPAYTTIQTTVYRMEAKEVVHRVKKVGNFHVFAASITQKEAQRRIVDDLLSYFGGRSQPVMAHLVESGKLSLEEVKEAERLLKKLSTKEKQL